jgi:D-glycero-alpha-D-manno-heptose-7-phosphate kinase
LTPNVLRDKHPYQPFDLNATLHEGGNYRVFMAKTVTVRVPVRIDLAGGWTDVPAYCSDHVGEVINIAINRYITAEMHIDDDRKITVQYSSDVPVGSGLGTSGAMNVALLAAISGEGRTPEEIAELAFQFEALLGNTGGRQDQWASALGGIQHLQFDGDTVTSTQMNPSSEFMSWIEKNLLLFDSGISHVSGDLHQEVWRKYSRGDQGIKDGLERIRHMAQEMLEAIQSESPEYFTRSLHRAGRSVNLLGKEFNEPFEKCLEPLQFGESVMAWKVMGAGAGGVVGIVLNAGYDRKAVTELAKEQGWAEIEWAIEHQGIVREVNLHE